MIVLFWALLFDSAALQPPHLSSSEWFAAVFAAYVVGHLVQAIANLYFERFPSLRPKAREAWDWMPPTLRNEILAKIHVAHLSAAATRDEQEAFAYKVFEMCDITVAQKGVAGGSREIYQYREGFYRGLTVSFVIGLIAVIVRATRSGDALVGAHHFVTGDEYLVTCLLLAVATYLAYHRYLRFFAYKLHNAYGSFASITGLIE